MDSTTGNQQPSSTAKLGWLAGIIDGEGCLQLARQKYKDRYHFRPQIVIGNTNTEIITEIVAIAKAHNLPVYVMDRHYAAQNSLCTTQVIQIMGLQRVSSWLSVVSPYLVGKKKQAEVLQHFIKYRLSQPKPFKGSNTFGEKDLDFRSQLDKANHQYRTRTAQRLNAEQTS